MVTRWDSRIRLVAGTIIAFLTLALLYFVRPLFQPLVIAAILAYVLHPIVDFVDRRTRLPRPLVVGLTFVTVLAALVMGVMMFVPDLVRQLFASVDQLLEVEALIAERFGFELQLTRWMSDLQSEAERWLNVDNVLYLFQVASANIVWTMISLVSAYYLLLDWGRLRDWLIGLAPRGAQADLQRLYVAVRVVWQRYLRGQLALMFVVGALSGLGGMAVGLPGAAALGLMAGVLDIIPTFGPWIAMSIATAIGWLAGSTYLQIDRVAFALLVLGIYSLVQLIENLWLRPRIMGYSVQLHPGLVFVAFFAALALSGVVLAVLIVPLVATVFIVGRYVRGRMLGVDPWAKHALAVDTPEEQRPA